MDLQTGKEKAERRLSTELSKNFKVCIANVFQKL